ncbi:phosphoenolpyruvate--protein phosphotransferase [Kushneria indalinina]|uniref:phosphoenolpyruvate--protein phosphotransferase n=1 Tax=Kushneria indalinina DSM 14324 TaxID=1122140 RepID=A0A3D9DXJ3_9GAMM|nr:phosphoenolpyruvate--protein phosphotransferase [Kushneria indalinina]REC95500.1 phosphocarrier protein HPr /phosphoenolpyruvate--protein phosphotransferase /PTS system D-fructose-specific IIA component (F1P-forming) (Frc family) [Kushneria indalinina DSM 14324]
MLTLKSDAVLLNQHASDWRDALHQAGQSLMEGGLAREGYRDALFEREEQASTWLGNGIVIPHGTQKSREHVLATGVRLLQFPEGVEWHDGNRVHLIITIAAQSDEHLDILRQLTHVLDREGVADRLARAGDAEEVVSLLSKAPVTARLDGDTIIQGVPARSSLELTAAVAARLEQLGCVDRRFVGDILGQQAISLGQQLWLVRSATGVIQPALGLALPQAHIDGVAGVFCLAESGNAHDVLLDRLVSVLEEGKGEELARLGRDALLARLSGESASAETVRVRVRNAHGLHARPAKQLVQIARAQKMPVRVRLAEGGNEAVSAASLTKVIGLGARRGQMLIFSAEGEGAREAVDAMAEALRGGLGEEVTPLGETSDARPSRNRQTPREPVVAPAADTPLAAVPASPGMAIAPVFVMRPPEFHYEETASDRQLQKTRLGEAISEAEQQLEEMIRAAGGEVAEILSMHEEMLGDPELREAAYEAINEGKSAEGGWWRAIDVAARAQEALADRLLAERAADLRDVGRRVLGNLCGVKMPDPPTHPYILVTDDVGPSDVARLDTSRVRGILTARGGATSHSAILARALGIPAVVGAGETIMALENGIDMILDGERGRVIPSPAPERRARTELSIREREIREREAFGVRFDPAITLDGHRVEVAANLGNTAHAADAVERGAEAVGLLRTEFVFMAHPQAPDLETQIAEYAQAFDALGHDRALVARTLDVGGDKPLDYWPVPAEDNPFLGLRGIRLALTRPDVLETQIRALLMAAGDRPLRIMFPMVKDVEEFHAGKAIFDRVQAEVQAPDVQLGVMIEIPSCALLAPSLAEHVDFFSIGTNDLTQYTLAIDRGHSRLSAQADGLHPAVLRLIQLTVDAAHAKGRWVGVCGELGSDPQAIGVLMGLGVDELSVSSRQIPLVKQRIRSLSLEESRALALRALACPTAAEVRAMLESLT